MSLTATCHCGATRIELPRAPVLAKRCNCTYCARAGAVWAYYPAGELRVLASEGERTYAPTGLNIHHFCGTCGMQTWGDSPDWASLYNADGTPKDGYPNAMPTARIHAVNMNLVDGFDLTTIPVEELDGRNSW